MVRVFSLLITLAATMQSANAALLASWNFATNADGAVSAGLGASATAFSNTGPTVASGGVIYGNNGSRNAGGFWRTSQFNNQTPANVLPGRYSSLTFTNESAVQVFQLGSVSFRAKNQTGIAERGVKVTYSVNGGAEVDAGSFTRTTTTFTTSTAQLDAILRQNDTLKVFFRFFKNEANTTNRQLDLDDIQIDGDVVPEPASLAVFGLVGAGLAIARRRKK